MFLALALRKIELFNGKTWNYRLFIELRFKYLILGQPNDSHRIIFYLSPDLIKITKNSHKKTIHNTFLQVLQWINTNFYIFGNYSTKNIT